MTGKFFSGKKFFFLPTDPEKSWKVTGNDNIILSRLMCIAVSEYSSLNTVWCRIYRAWEKKILWRFFFQWYALGFMWMTMSLNKMQLDVVIS